MSKKSRKHSSSRRHDDDPVESAPDEWEQFTSPDGHPYYYNAATKESRWELPSEETDAPVRSKPHRRSSRGIGLDQEKSLDKSLNVNKEKKKKEKEKEKKKKQQQQPKEEDEGANAAAVKAPNAMFQQLQASLEGRLGAIHAPMMGRPPPMLNIRREEEVEYAGGATGQEETKTPSVEEQYEAETAGMSAAERLRFLRKKRQENMMTKRESIAGDDFMAEVANNMKKKKGITAKAKEEERDGSEKMQSWEEQEKAEEERKRQQMQQEMEAKQQEAEKKEREQQAAKEREERREQERAEQLELERRREQERKQRQEEESRKKQEKEDKKTNMKEKDAELGERIDGQDTDRDKTGATGPDVQSHSSVGDSIAVQGEDNSDASSPERVKHRRRSRSRGSKHGISVNRGAIKQAESVEDDHLPPEDRQSAESEVAADTVQDEKQRAREEQRARKQHEKELVASKPSSVTSESPRRKSISSSSGLNEEPRTRSTSSIEAEEEAKAREKQLRRERRRMAKMKAALAAQSLDANGDQGDVQREQIQGKGSEPHMDSSNGPTPGSAHAGGYPVSGQPLPGHPPFSGGMYTPYPYGMMPPPPPPPSPYGYYYPYMQPPSMPMPMYPPGMVPPGYQLMPTTPPHSANGMTIPSALIPYGTDSMLANAYGYDMNFGGMQSGPELSRCDCCKGIGVGLVEKNGVCAHCNRLRLAFIVDSAQMRLRCSVCGGWGFQLLQANGMCEHCTRQSAQKSQRRYSAAARRPSSVATAITAVVARRNSTENPSKKDGLDDVDWDKSSSDDSDWDD